MGEYNPPINVTLISAQGIKNENWFTKMDVYAEAWIEGLIENKKSTCVAKKCGTNPKWDYNRMTFTYAELYPGGRNPDPYLVVQLMAKGSGRSTTDKMIGSVTIRINDFFYGMNDERTIQYKICMKSGKTKGLLQLSYDFESEQPETEAEAEANEPLQEYPKTCDHLTFKDSDTSDKDLQTNLTVYKPEIKPQSNKSLSEYQTRLTINKPYESESEYRRTYNHLMFGNRYTSEEYSLLSAANILSIMRG